jgi:outer membrane protein TolC
MRLPAVLASVAALAACSLAPKYDVPATPVAAQYKTYGPWTSAQPADQIDRNGWWKMYGDTQLDDLETRLLANNTDLRAAYAHYAQAQAFVAQVESGLYPTVSANAVPLRERQSDTAPLRGNGPADYNSVTLGAQVNYNLDLWGRVRDSVLAGKDEAQATKAETAFAKALQLTQTLHSHGIVSGLDVSRAQTQLSSAQSQLSQNLAQRALMEHAIAVLVGTSAAEFSLPQQTAAIALPAIPTDLPSTLLQRRPDVAAAERRVAEANAKIGVARAAYFPNIGLTLQGGVQSAAYSGLVSAPNLFWAIGPQLVQYVFDGGLRRAQLDAAKAATEEAGDRYRGVVLTAFQQVEDNLALLSYLGTALGQQRDAAAAAQTSVDLALQQYKQGTVGYLDVVQAQTVQLDAQRSVLDIQTRQLSANVQLLDALGGGWSSDELAQVAATPELVATTGQPGKTQ